MQADSAGCLKISFYVPCSFCSNMWEDAKEKRLRNMADSFSSLKKFKGDCALLLIIYQKKIWLVFRTASLVKTTKIASRKRIVYAFFIM